MKQLASCFLLLAIGLMIQVRAQKEGCEKDRRHKALSSKLPYKPSLVITKEVSCTGSLEMALIEAVKAKKKVLLAFLGESDVKSARDLDLFSQPEINTALKMYIIVVLHADIVPARYFKEDLPRKLRTAEGESNYDFECRVFGTRQIPLFAVLTPTQKDEFQIFSTFELAASDDMKG